jgi:hypothetical protein
MIQDGVQGTEHGDGLVDRPPSAYCNSVPGGNSQTPFFFLSCAHRSHHPFILSLPFAFPTLTVGITLSILSAQQKTVNSLKELCSEYGTPKQLARLVHPRCGTRSRML